MTDTQTTRELGASDTAHALADAAGSAVLIVIHDSQRYLGVGDALAGEADNKSLALE